MGKKIKCPHSSGPPFSKDLPDAQLITYEKTGHLITEEKPENVFEISYPDGATNIPSPTIGTLR